MISKKGKRSVEFRGERFYWHIKKNSRGVPEITVISEDKATRLTYGFDREIGIGSQYIKKLLEVYYNSQGENV